MGSSNSNLHPMFTHMVHIYITHYLHTHPKLKVSVGLVDPGGSTSTSKGPPPQNPHHPQSTSKPGQWVVGLDPQCRWIYHPQSTRKWAPAHPSTFSNKEPDSGGKKTVLQGIAMCHGGRPSWMVLGGWGERAPPKRTLQR